VSFELPKPHIVFVALEDGARTLKAAALRETPPALRLHRVCFPGNTSMRPERALRRFVPSVVAVGKHRMRSQITRCPTMVRAFHFARMLMLGLFKGQAIFRDKVRMPFPYLQVDFRIHGAASGGPIFSDGRVIAVNCSEWPENIDHPPGPGFGAQIRCLKDAFIDDVVLSDADCPHHITFDELVRTGSINVANYVSRDANAPLFGSVLRLDMPATAKRPEVEVSLYF